MEHLCSVSTSEFESICRRLSEVKRPSLVSAPLPTSGVIDAIADPFAIYVDDRLYLFCELEARSEGGYFKRIAVYSRANEKSALTFMGYALDDDSFEYSFPYVFRVNDHFYLFPDITDSRNRTKKIVLYKASHKEFPFGWVEVSISVPTSLKDVSDKVIFQNKNLWWMLLSSSEGGGTLKALYSDDMVHWMKPDRPILIRRSTLERIANKFLSHHIAPKRAWRLGGGPFLLDGQLAIFLQHQFETNNYGEALSLLKISRLSKKGIEFNIESKPRLKADSRYPWKSAGCHHFAIARNNQTLLATNDGFDGEKWTSHLESL